MGVTIKRGGSITVIRGGAVTLSRPPSNITVVRKTIQEGTTIVQPDGDTAISKVSPDVSISRLSGGNGVTIVRGANVSVVRPSNDVIIQRGATGPPGKGIPPGGLRGQYAVKASDKDYELTWADAVYDPTVRYTHFQNTPSDVWTVDHRLGRNPVISIQDNAGNQIVGQVYYLNDQILTVRFSFLITGRVDCT